jgi:hypothetical protein
MAITGRNLLLQSLNKEIQTELAVTDFFVKIETYAKGDVER